MIEYVDQCPKCRSTETGVHQTRLQKMTGFIRRQRKCHRCGQLWSTVEVPLAMKTRLMDVEKLLKKLRTS
jgi:transcriptional regulator NrdR family protein